MTTFEMKAAVVAGSREGRGRGGSGARIAGALKATFWTAVVVAMLWFVATKALRYLAPGGTDKGRYVGVGALLRLHIFAGMAALFAGLAQFRSGTRARRSAMHRWVGRGYLSSVALGAMSAIALMVHKHDLLVFDFGLSTLTAVWVGTSVLALIAIRSGDVAEHRVWMRRSYVMTFAFVVYRMITSSMRAAHVGTFAEQAGLASWACWAVPLIVVEGVVVMQKVWRSRPREAGARS